MQRTRFVMVCLLPLAAAPAVASDNHASIAQDGNTHAASISQHGGALAVDAAIVQAGSANHAEVDQSGYFGHTATIHQGGTANFGEIHAQGASTPELANVVATIDTTGTHNRASIEQRAMTETTGLITQNGRNVTATLIQSVTNGRAVITQTGGTEDEAHITQNGITAFAEISQTGTRLAHATISQHNDLSGGSIQQADTHHVIATIDMADGSYCTETIVQINGSDYAEAHIFRRIGEAGGTILQDGAAHSTARMFQEGEAVTGTITQAAAYNDAELHQGGYRSVAEITQSGAGTSRAHNHALIDHQAEFDTASIIQTGGAGNGAAISQF